MRRRANVRFIRRFAIFLRPNRGALLRFIVRLPVVRFIAVLLWARGPHTNGVMPSAPPTACPPRNIATLGGKSTQPPGARLGFPLYKASCNPPANLARAAGGARTGRS